MHRPALSPMISAGAVVGTVLLAALLAGCSADDPAPDGAGVATLTPAPGKPTDPAGSLAGAQTPAPATGAPAAQCPDGGLLVSVTQVSSSSSGTRYRLTFRNTGSTTCELRGAPQLAVAGASGERQLGPAATVSSAVPDAEDAITVDVAPGASVVSDFVITDLAGALPPGCTLVYGDGWLVVPPYSPTQFFVPRPRVPACADGPATLTILTPVAAP